MPLPTVFLALQCCQCSTMQVKQQKRSSNKWTCVVCNQKQSVRKVFAKGFMAKDVRKFVQNFNMSRMFAEQSVFPVDDREENLEIEEQIPGKRKQKRTDWTEYIEPQKDSGTPDFAENPEDDFEVKIATELPKPVLKKPKLKSYRVAKDCEGGDDENSPVDFVESLAGTKTKSQGCQSRRFGGVRVRETQRERTRHGTVSEGKFADKQEEMKLKEPTSGMFERKEGLVQDDNVRFSNETPGRNQSGRVDGGRSSKWSCYIAEEDDDSLLGSGNDLRNRANKWCDQNVFETELLDQMVDEDIHPDFL